MLDKVKNTLNKFPNPIKLSNSFDIDIQENDEKYIVRAALPGVSKAHIDISYKLNNLIINIKGKSNLVKENYIKEEIYKGPMEREILLPYVISDSIKATMDNGILTIELKKDQKLTATKKINID